MAELEKMGWETHDQSDIGFWVQWYAVSQMRCIIKQLSEQKAPRRKMWVQNFYWLDVCLLESEDGYEIQNEE